MRRSYLALIFLAPFLVGACTTSPKVASTVDAVAVTLTTAEVEMTKWFKGCTAGSIPATACPDAAAKQKIKDLDNTAYKAVMAAENNSALLSTAIDAVASFTRAVPTVTK